MRLHRRRMTNRRARQVKTVEKRHIQYGDQRKEDMQGPAKLAKS